MIKEVYEKIAKNNFDWIIIVISWPIAHSINQDAIIISRLFWYKKVLLWKDNPYIKTSFSKTYLKQVISKVKQEFSLSVQVWEIDKESRKVVFKTEHKAKYKIKKEELVNVGHLEQTIENMKDDLKEDVSKKILRFKDIEDRRFELHKKALETYKQVSFAIWKYLAKVYRESLAWEYFRFWHILLENINKLRSISMFDDADLIYREKIKIFYHISTTLDLLKDLTDNIFNLKWFKNRDQYLYIQTSIWDIAKMSRGTYSSFKKR